MATKLNIFNALPHHPSDDEDTHQGGKGAQGKTGGDKPKKDRVRKKGPKTEGTVNEPKAVGKDTHLPKDHKSRDHQLKKLGNDLDHPHTLDRRSGTGEQAFGQHDKKGGYGKFNKGSYKDELRGTRAEGEREGEEGDVEPASDEDDKTVTLDEYFGKTGAGEAKQQVNDTKTKITDDQLKKELGKATLLENRAGKEVDDRAITYKKNKTDAVIGMNTEHADLLGFRTGFRVYDDRKKRPQGGQGGDRTGDKPAEKEGEATGQTEENKGEEKKPEATEEKGKAGEEGQSPSGGQRGEGYKGDRRGGKGYNREGGYREGGYKEGGHREGGYKEGGYKGGYKGDNRGGYKGDNRGGYKGDNRGGYKGGNKGGATVNIEDDSSFPKLG